MADGEQLHTDGYEGVGLAGAGLCRLEGPPFGRLQVALHKAPGRLGHQPGPAEAGLGHGGGRGASRRQSRLDLRAIPDLYARGKAGATTHRSQQPWIVQAPGEVEEASIRSWRWSSVSGAAIAQIA